MADAGAAEDKRMRITDDFGQQVQMSEEQFADLVAQARAGALDTLNAVSRPSPVCLRKTP